MHNFYELLNATPTSTLEELKRNYKLLILQCHPDKLQQKNAAAAAEDASTTDEELVKDFVAVNLNTDDVSDDPNAFDTSTQIRKKFVAINEAWNTLKDPIKRKLYDAELLQTKFRTHSNVYDTITLNDMRCEEVLEDDEYNDNDDDDDDDELLQKESNDDNEQGTSATEVEVVENVGENQHPYTVVVDKEISAAGTTIYYVYDCRCGGQYSLDESSYKMLSSRRYNKKLHKCGGNKDNHQQQKQQQQNEKNFNHQHEEEQLQPQRPKSTSVELSDNDDDEDDDDDVIIECSECSLSTKATAARCRGGNANPTHTQIMASTGDIWLQWFSCCFHQPQSPSRRRHHQRLRIDRSMIGNPTNFVHTGHIGSGDVELSTNHLNAISTQMQSKGGYETNAIRLHAC